MRLSSTVILFFVDSILLIKRKREPFKGYWALPGGAKQTRETFLDCAIREVKEETGINLKNTKLDYIYNLFVTNELGEQKSRVFMANLDAKFKGYSKNDFEVDDIKLFSLKLLPSPIVPFHKELIEKYCV